MYWFDWYFMCIDVGFVFEFIDMGVFLFFVVEGFGVYEILVGLVYVGFIEFGYFWFFVVGEMIVWLKVWLWFVYCGIEKFFYGCFVMVVVDFVECISGDMLVVYVFVYSLVIEDVFGIELFYEIYWLWVLIVEFEWFYNYVVDLGVLVNDVGYLLVNVYV